MAWPLESIYMYIAKVGDISIVAKVRKTQTQKKTQTQTQWGTIMCVWTAALQCLL